jgi:hypothetical protein
MSLLRSTHPTSHTIVGGKGVDVAEIIVTVPS